ADAQAAIRGRRDRAAAAAAAFADDSDEGGSDDSEESEGADGEQDSTDDSDDSDESEDDDAGESTNEDDSDDTDTDEKEFAVKRRYGGATAGYRGEAKSPTPFTLDPAAPNFKSGEATFLDFAEAFNGISSGRALRATTVGQQTQSHFGHIRRYLPTELVASDEASLVAAIDHATDESRLDGGSLVAAAGWCAPSETIYDFLPTPAAANLFSLPEISLSRGGLRYPVEPDFST
ncbi:major capsid protein, partial [Cutibacterium acnes]